MHFPSRLNWYESRSMCRRFGGRLHIDKDPDSIISRSYPMVEFGEKLRPSRCDRVWLGASDEQEEGVWRDSETDEILDITPFWVAGQPNGVRVQNCAGIWELVIHKALTFNIYLAFRIGWRGKQQV